MKLIHSVDHSGTAGKTGSKFTGNVYNYLTMPATDGITINSVNFTPGARTFCLLYTSPSPRDLSTSRMPSSA